jgi:hypothetical protein
LHLVADVAERAAAGATCMFPGLSAADIASEASVGYSIARPLVWSSSKEPLQYDSQCGQLDCH